MAKQVYTTGQILTAAQMTTLQTNDYNQTVSAKTASYVLVAADAGTTITMSNASATTITVNTSLFTAGDTLEILNLGAGVCTITAGTATVSTAGSLALNQYNNGTLYFSTSAVAIFSGAVSGDITSVGVTSPITGGGSSGAVTIAIQDATTSVKGSVQLSDSVSTTSSILAATPTAVKSAYDLATTASTNANNITMVQQYTATESVLKNISSRIPAGEQLLKQAVYWIDAAQSDNSDQVLDNQGWGGTTITTQLGSTASADSNDPKFLDFDGTNYVYLPGVASNFLSTPDATALDIVGDIDLRVQVAMDDWTPSSNMVLLSKYLSPSNQSFRFFQLSSGFLQLITYADGVTARSSTATVTTGVTDGAVKWVRATLDVDNGAVGSDVKFFTSNDGITWTQLGATVTTALTTSIYSGTAQVEIGSNDGGSSALAGKVYRAQILNGIDGTKVLDVDTSVIGSGSATSFSALTGQTVTINRSTSGKKTAIVTAPAWLFGTDDYMEVADNALLDFSATESLTLLYIGRQFATPASFGMFIEKIASGGAGYTISGASTNFYPDLALRDGTTTLNPTITTPTWSAGTLFTVGMLVDRSTQTLGYAVNGTLSSTASTSAVGSLANANVLTINKRSISSSFFNDSEMYAVAIFRRVLTAAELLTITNYYTARVGA